MSHRYTLPLLCLTSLVAQATQSGAAAQDAVAVSTTTAAEATTALAGPQLKITPTGRILMDGGVFITNATDEIKSGVDVPEVRVGVKAAYGSWRASIDVGYAFGKVGLKDVYVQKDFNAFNMLRFGYFVHNFGLQSATSSSMKISMEEPPSNEAFGYPRLLGVMYLYDRGDYFAAASLHAESAAMKLRAGELGETGYGGITRLVWRPRHATGNVAQIGLSAAFSNAQHSDDPALNHHLYSINANFPTRVNQVSAVGADITDARTMFKFTPELLLNYSNLALESQYYWMQVNRKDHAPAYRAYGAYGMLRCLAIGGNYSYSHADGALATPLPGSLEFVLGYNYTCLSSDRTGIYGGRLNDVSLTANWYINKYMIWRFRAAYTYRFDRSDMPDVHLGALQTRFQIIF